jgi:hypothetical protein
MSIMRCERHARSYDSDWDTTCPECASEPRYYCGDCDRYEDDPMWVDLEQCSCCGEYITAEDEPSDGLSPRERAWHNYGLSQKDFI